MHPFKEGEEFWLTGAVFSNGETCLTVDIVTGNDNFQLVEENSLSDSIAGAVSKN